jgi:alkanesulfonate monooxygenase SsuD/methylene tetrahydromethanopterin reductase-like flavin-dependent oxidoreductase (luciferase family)
MPAAGVLLPRDLPAPLVVAYARRAEELGFDELWVVEDLGFRGGVAQAATVLASTTTIRVGIGVLPTGARQVAFAAMELGTLAELFPGRLDAGVGHGMAGWMCSVGAWPASPLTLLEEYTTALRSLLRGEEVTVDGRYVQLTAARLESPPEVVPDVLLGVRGPRSLAVSGAVADGTVLAEPVTPEYARAARSDAAPRGPHRVVAYNAAAVDDDGAAALAAVRPGLAWIGDPDWAPHLAPLPFAAALADLRASSANREEFAARMPDDWVSRLAVAGTPAATRARLRDLAAAGVTSSVLIPVGPDPFAALAQLSAVL